MPYSPDENYWKDRYKDTWKTSSSREKNVLSLITEAGFKDAELTGLGAGSSEFLSGSPANYGKSKGDPDIEIPSVKVAVEVTGTDVPHVKVSDELWVRPDKVENARDHPKRDTWVVHSLDQEGTIRAVHLTPETIKKLLSTEKIHPYIRRSGTRETYIPISAKDPMVEPFTRFLEYLQRKRTRGR